MASNPNSPDGKVLGRGLSWAANVDPSKFKGGKNPFAEIFNTLLEQKAQKRGGTTSAKSSSSSASDTSKTSSPSESPAKPKPPKKVPKSNKWSDVVDAYFPGYTSTTMKAGGLVKANGCAKRGKTKGRIR